MKIETFGSSSSGNCYRLTGGNTSILLDAGLPFKQVQRSCGFMVNKLQAVLISHVHGDHTKAVPELLKAGIKCYMLAPTAQAMNIPYLYNVRIVESLKQFTVGEFQILPFPLEHDVPNTGYLIQYKHEKLVYITDTYYCRYKFPGLTHIMVEANHSYKILNQKMVDGDLAKMRRRRLIQSHFAIENVVEFLKSNDLSRVEEIHLLHLSDENSNEEEFKNIVQRATGKVVIVDRR